MTDMDEPFARFEGIRPTVRYQWIAPGRIFKLEVRPNGEAADNAAPLHTVFFSKSTKAIELTAMTGDELRKLREFWNRTIDQALDVVDELDEQAEESLNQGRPVKRLYRPPTKLLIFPEGGGIPEEWSPDVHTEDAD